MDTCCLQELASNHNPPDLCFPSSWDHSCEPLHQASFFRRLMFVECILLTRSCVYSSHWPKGNIWKSCFFYRWDTETERWSFLLWFPQLLCYWRSWIQGFLDLEAALNHPTVPWPLVHKHAACSGWLLVLWRSASSLCQQADSRHSIMLVG
jgi:hypothetical protein